MAITDLTALLLKLNQITEVLRSAVAFSKFSGELDFGWILVHV
jgi:hypothetical protein